MRYKLLIEDLDSSRLYFRLLQIEFPEYKSRNGKISWRPNKKYPYLTVDTENKYIYATNLKYNADKEIDNFKELINDIYT